MRSYAGWIYCVVPDKTDCCCFVGGFGLGLGVRSFFVGWFVLDWTCPTLIDYIDFLFPLNHHSLNQTSPSLAIYQYPSDLYLLMKTNSSFFKTPPTFIIPPPHSDFGWNLNISVKGADKTSQTSGYDFPPTCE